jgi:hypothetical protein
MTLAPPPVISWFKIYCWALCALYLLVVGAIIVFLVKGSDWLTPPPEFTDRIIMSALGAISLALLAGCAVPLFVKPRPWVWVYSLILICFGMTSGCVMLASIPLLIFWLKPDVKAYYAYSGSAPAPMPFTAPEA